MQAACEPLAHVEFRHARAESIPADDETFDLVVVALAFHWFDQEAFLGEAFRVLTTYGWLLIYTAGFTGRMREDAGFSGWFRGAYLSRYPTPPRHEAPITGDRARECGLVLRGEERFSLEVPMSAGRFTDYQLSTTNVIASVRDDPVLLARAERWISESLDPFFDGHDELTFLFSGNSWYLQKAV